MSTHPVATADERLAGRHSPAARDGAGGAGDTDEGNTPLPGNPIATLLPSDSRNFLDLILSLNLLTRSSAGRFLVETGSPTAELATPAALAEALVHAGLLTEYQVDRVLGGSTYGLILGNYRVLERIGAGGMSCVFLAEHCLMKRRVAVKVLPMDDDCPASVRQRFYAEMRVLAELHHPHIVLAFDAGETASPDGRLPPLIYLVMELVSGGDLEQYVNEHGARPLAQACEWVRQAACGLQHAHDHHLIHRDVKPSNLLLGERGQVKVVDFGLARQFSSCLTDPRALLGSLEFMAPEQSFDPSAVAAGADVYGLGATLFWLMTGEAPYPSARSVGAALRAIQQQPPRRLSSLRPDVPLELDDCVAHMMARDPRDRHSSPLAVMNALAPFALTRKSETFLSGLTLSAVAAAPADYSSPREKLGGRVLLVDDDPIVRQMTRRIVESLGCVCDEAETGEQALAAVRTQPRDLLLLDLTLPDMDGFEVCRRLRERPPHPHLKIIIVSGRGDQDELAEALPRGADDYIPKPFQIRQLIAKVRHALRLKEAQDQSDELARQLLITNEQLENSLHARGADVRQAQNALLLAMAKMAESRDGETPGHLRRLQRYSCCLAQQAGLVAPWHGLVDARFLEQLDRCVPLHDIGKISLPDELLLKTGQLSTAERHVIETHVLVGDRILETLSQEHGASLEFLGMARSIVRGHHERFDGGGYPDKLKGEAIPAAARIVAVVDVYDALRRQRPYKPALSHNDAVRVILRESPGQFDPALLDAFSRCPNEFMNIYRQIAD
jgi:response regulator RpfG family c-di-GMP phosphodiesterase/tRNA A-37 threonylcarbamoyl transferase component Bud32